jgi:hypothetical protein
MASRGGIDSLPVPLADVVATAVGQEHRDDPVRPGTGGPAGNARLTAWLGVLLLAAFLVECVTLVSLDQLVAVHIFVGAMLVPLALVKTATTAWRMGRYYAGNPEYRRAGPPPLLLRLLGPLVVLTALAVLGTGLALLPLKASSHQPFVTVAGFAIGAFTLHQAAFAVWLVITSLHTLARTVPALMLATHRVGSRTVPGAARRLAVLLATVGAAVVSGVVVLSLAGGYWSAGFGAQP